MRDDKKHRDAGPEWVTVASFGNVLEASLVKGALEAAGIKAIVPAEVLGAFSLQRSVPFSNVASVLVQESDREKAIQILKTSGTSK